MGSDLFETTTWTSREKKQEIRLYLLIFFARMIFFKLEYFKVAELLSYGHTTVKAPHPIRTAKLSIVGPDQYFGGGPQGNLGCCMSFCTFGRLESARIVAGGFRPPL